MATVRYPRPYACNAAELDALREQRLQQLQLAARKRVALQSEGHGRLVTVSETDVQVTCCLSADLSSTSS